MTKSTINDSIIKLDDKAIKELNSILNKNYESVDDVRNDYKSTNDIICALSDKLVPDLGRADTVAGECLRALNRVLYRYYNDGDVAGYGYGVETVASSLGYIVAQLPEVDYIAIQMIDYTDCCNAYEDRLNDLAENVLYYLLHDDSNYFTLDSGDDDSRHDWWDVLFDNYNERNLYPDEEEDADCC